MPTPAEADLLIGQHLQCLPIESLPLTQCAGAVLRENVYAERDQPPFDRATLEGVALDSRAVSGGRRSFRIQGRQAAGDPPLTLASSDSCIQVASDAELPGGCDCVVAIEELTVANGEAALHEAAHTEAWQCVQRRGSAARQGALLLPSGQRLRAPQIAVAAAAGMARMRVSSQPMLAIISAGRELIEPGEPLLAHQVRRSNAYAIVSALREQGFQRVADDHLQEDAAQMRERLRFHLQTHDVLVISEGASSARFDLVAKTLEELGVRPVFRAVAQRPGSRMRFGVAPSGAAVFGLPGSPLSSLLCLTRYVLPALDGSLGRNRAPEERIALGAPVTLGVPLTHFLPVRCEQDEWGRTWAQPVTDDGAGDFTALVDTDGFVELPPGPNTYAKGFMTRLYRWA